MRTQRITISVIGGSKATSKTVRLAEQVGQMIGELDCVLVCGGLMGVMEAAARGAKKSGGLTVGLLPGNHKHHANDHIDIALPTSIGFARNAIVACSADIVVALPGSHGTNSEICYAIVYDRPVINLGGWKVPGMINAKNVEDAKTKIKRIIKKLHNARAA
jgi:uncharacterized protein (TIGR00725 family)